MDYPDMLGPDGSENNMGGTELFIFFASHGDIKTFGLPPAAPANPEDAYDITTAHVMNTGKKFTKLYVTADTSEVEAALSGEIDGKSFAPLLKFFHPGSSKKLIAMINKSKNDKFVFLIPLADGRIVQLGSAKFPAYMGGSLKTGTISGRGKGAEFEVKAWQPDIVTYSAAIPLTPGA